MFLAGTCAERIQLFLNPKPVLKDHGMPEGIIIVFLRAIKLYIINQKIKVMLVVLEVVALLAVIILPLFPAKKVAK